MPSINLCVMMGNLTRDPDLRATPSGSPVCELALAVTRKSNGREDICFIDVVVWGKNAENCKQYLVKGSCVSVEGYLKQESWEDRQSGQRRSRLKLVCETIQFISSPRNADNRAPNRPQGTPGANPQSSSGYAESDQPPPPPSDSDLPDAEGDIPF